jgi:2-isopropylmalate synthase
MKQVRIFDTTLRDGEQAPGCSMNLKEKIEVARQLERLGVDIIEAGFAISSPGDFESVKTIAESVKNMSVASLSRALEKDIDASYEALRNAVSPRIHVFLATSPVHMQFKLKKTPEQVLEQTRFAVAYAKKKMSDVEFSCEDATRSELPFLAKVVSAAIDAGATVVNVPDTVGFSTPEDITAMIEYLKAHCENLHKAELSLHNHNDLGMAVANTLAGIKAGATQVECTINGLGERAGNASLEEIVMALRTRKSYYEAETRIDTTQIYRTSRLVYGIIGMSVPLNKPVVGVNAFLHESGIHQHGVMAEHTTYEIMTPESIGLNKNRMVLGKHSGKHAFEERLSELGYKLDDQQIADFFEQFKVLCDKKKVVSDRDIEAIVDAKITARGGEIELDRFTVHAGNHATASCVVRLKKGDGYVEEVALGDGPIDAAYNAIDKCVAFNGYKLEDYGIHSISEGKDALGEVIVKLKNGDETVTGRGLSTDIIESSILAYINGLNKILETR